jgi:general secretion pathway protein C
MRLAIDPRSWRRIRRLPRTDLYSLAEILLLALLAWQTARLVWALLVPLGPLGDWRPPAGPDAARGRATLASGFDPFFRLASGNGPAVVTSLQLTLFGVRVDEASGRGSAIIAGPDGVQASYAVGDEILPGVTLKTVGFDNVVISRNGADETMFLDQSNAAPVAAPGSAQAIENNALLAPSASAQPVSLADLRTGITVAPRSSHGRVTGLAVRAGTGDAFARAGFRPGDVIAAINGRPVASPDDLQRAAATLAAGGSLSLGVERGADVVPLTISISGR